MRGREASVLILFHTTTEAMAMEAACGRDGLPGRLIPIPSFVSAGLRLRLEGPGGEAGTAPKLHEGKWTEL